MQRALLSALLGLTVTTVTFTGGPSAVAADPNGKCAMPVPVRSYSDSQITYRVSVDLTDCAWWDGSPMQLDASLERIDPVDSHGVTTATVCGSDFARQPEDRSTSDGAARGRNRAKKHSAARPRNGRCEIEVVMEHPTAEAASYRGEATFPWEDGRRGISFSALCGPGTGCVDLPADSADVLAPAADLYDAVAGGDE